METNMNYNQYIPTRILFGAGQLNNPHYQPITRIYLTEPD